MHSKISWAVRSALGLGIGLLAMTATVSAQSTAEGLELAQRKACMACHQVDTKRVGPPLISVAERYAGQGEAMVQYLAERIRGGGRGAWGAVPMPAQSQVNPDEATQLAQWILSLAPAKPQ